ncbi:something about silencing, SAS, complex subunit 4-domain-containing protein [Echria macrotheca]|uniref:Something about silencing, SAS, complex subunit 4-domain-containing protein n=1 Tax=Echria macrotheca TaxID=438768 RepID=A0AAJ0F545_9PEZI|nr:something about silencing, SAS, complex subunit 4-domain-containing protein [Echria macrotheca]
MQPVQMAMPASATRPRRAEGPHRSHHNTRHPPQLTANARAQNNTAFAANQQRAKRLSDPTTHELDPVVTKKVRLTTGIAVEIPSRAVFHSRTAADAKRAPSQQQVAARNTAIADPNTGLATSRPPAPPPTVAKAAPINGNRQQPRSGLTKHKEKVVNGLKHELNRLQPSLVDTKDQGRKLRSQEATRFKSELSAYFPDYDEVIGNEPKEQHLLNPDTPFLISTEKHADDGPRQPPDSYATRSYGDTLFSDLWDSQRIDFGFLATQYKNKPVEDPLPDTVFEPAHKKSERLERSIRNTEKGRAQHEKDQIHRLLDGLQGPDWLRVMGVSGITESRKKTFEPARDHFIKGCQAILEKFRRWAAEEKRRKLEKEERAHAEAAARREAEEAQEIQDSQDEEDADDEAEDEVDKEIPDSDEEMDEVEMDNKDADPPDDSDVDASIAKQLREEALAAQKKRSRRTRVVRTPPLPTPPPRPEQKSPEFRSFFRKKYQRDAALSKNRRKGRNVLAWGHPVPEPEQRDFELPRSILNEDTLRAHERRMRISRRGRRTAK